MRILTLSNLYPPDFTGGYELICGQVVDALRSRGHEVCVLTSAPRYPVPSEPHVLRRLQLTPIFETGWALKIGAINRHLNEVQASLINAQNVHALLTALEEFQPDVVLLYHLLGLGGLGLLGCLHHLRIPWVWHLEDAVPRGLCSLTRGENPTYEEPFGKAVPALVSEYNRQLRGHYLACSRRVVREIEGCGLQLNGSVELVPNWITGSPPPPRTRFFQGGKLRIVSAGAISLHKGVDLLIEAAALLRKRGYENFAIDFYGKVTGPVFQGWIDQHDLRGHVTLQGERRREDLLPLFGEYDVFAFPTWTREPFGVAPLEAAAYGCVPVISRCCGIAEWLVGNVHCLKAERSAEAFARVLAEILDGKIDLAPVASRCQAVVWRDFHLDTLIPRFEKALLEAAGQDRGGAGTPQGAYHLALLAERCAQVVVHESRAA